MIEEFIKEYRKLKWQYENKVDDAFWFLRELDNLVDRYETELNIQSLKELSIKPTDLVEDDEPYFGWCDVSGCEEEGCSGGIAWSDTGYWTVCSKHADHYREGKLQPQMKQAAIDRENSRDIVTRYLPIGTSKVGQKG